MGEYSVSKSFAWEGEITDKGASVMRMFGLTSDRLAENEREYGCRLKIEEGDIVYITGPSGSGKSVLLAELERCIRPEERVNLNEVEVPVGKSVIDSIEGDFLTSLRLLSTAGLNDCFCVLRRAGNLSEGQKYRFRLAMSLAAGKKFIFADEFCANLDRITASVIAFNIGRYARRHKVTFILAASHDDILADLSPDVLVLKELSGEDEVIYKRS
jgi:ABC-type ATPase with predicted acetyltransferase domain